jgi:hypothetical protein
LIGTVIRFLANQIDEAQLKLKPGVTVNPTHTQLAKDHDDHPLHVLAATCAKTAVVDIGNRMKEIWEKGATSDRQAALLNQATTYFQHPDLMFSGPPVPAVAELFGHFQKFAADPANAGKIAQASQRGVLDSHLKEAKDFADRATKGINLERLKQIFGALSF